MRIPAFSIITRFSRDAAGAAAVEFAFVAVPFLSLILVSLQLATIFFFDGALQTVALKSARQLMTGSAQLSNFTQAQFKSAVCANAPSFFQCANIMVDVESASAFSSVNTSPLTLTYNAGGAVTNTWQYSPGNPGDVVIVRVMYNWPVAGGPLAFGLANQANGDHLLVATAVFKDEPYQ
jgi:Flp pilus assembly protein TadG